MVSRRQDLILGLLLVVVAAAAVIAVREHKISSYEVIFYVVLFASVIPHEIAHGVVALMFGDDTAKRAGRLTANPLVHIDPLGTVIVPAVMLATAGFAFGWAKPVPVDVSRLRNPRNHAVLVSLAGPALNISVAVIAGIAYGALVPFSVKILEPPFQPLPDQVLFLIGFVNVIVAVFNLIPIPPLDGSAVIERILPNSWWPKYLQFRMAFLPVVIILVLLKPGFLADIYNPALRLWNHLLS